MIRSFLHFVLRKGWIRFSLMFPLLSNKLKVFIFKNLSVSSKIDCANEQEIKAVHFVLESAVDQKRKTVLMLSVFPFRKPVSGGQIRCHAICEEYQKEGMVVVPFIVRDQNAHVNENNQQEEVIFPVFSSYRLYQNQYVPFIGDFCSGIFAENDERVLEALKRRIQLPVDVIHIEHPWLFPLALKFKNEFKHKSKPLLVYSSPNIEWRLKEQMLNQTNLSPNIIKKVVKDIKEFELNCSKNADIIVAVSETEKTYLEQEINKKVIYAPNASHQYHASQSCIDLWKKKLPPRFYLFTGSGHPPNLFGLYQCLKDSNQLPEEISIIIVGSIIETINQYPEKKQLFSHPRFIKLGIVEKEDLLAIIACAHGILIPITMGGGTNLKTPEALMSGKYIISTSFGMRGFEHYINQPGVYVSDTSADFQREMHKVWQLTDPDFVATRGNDLTWNHALKPLLRALI